MIITGGGDVLSLGMELEKNGMLYIHIPVMKTK